MDMAWTISLWTWRLNHLLMDMAWTTSLWAWLEPPPYGHGSNHLLMDMAWTTSLWTWLEPPPYGHGLNHLLMNMAGTTSLWTWLEPPPYGPSGWATLSWWRGLRVLVMWEAVPGSRPVHLSDPIILGRLSLKVQTKCSALDWPFDDDLILSLGFDWTNWMDWITFGLKRWENLGGGDTSWSVRSCTDHVGGPA